MTRKILHGLHPASYQHPFDRKALAALQKMPGLPLLLKKINEYGIDRLLRLQTLGNEFRVNPRNFPKLHNALVETCQILDEPLPDLYLYRGTGHINTYAVGVEKPLIGVNLETLEWLEEEELLFVLGHEIARIKGKYLTYQQLAVVMPFLKNAISTTTLGFGGLAANGLEVALYNWIVMAKLTADRAGLLACQDIDVAIASLMKLGGLPGEYLTPEVTQDFMQQAREFQFQELDGLDQVTKIFSFMEYRIPWHVMRASELLKWVETGEYSQWLQSDPSQQPQATEQPENVKDWDFLGNW
ncbi:M48 family metallopeptidase [Tolypothrix sp. PCC 7910]|uniref:M48 family metallopeptidase n=1 Tax=Tolypothrix sp. PCC 7910 TaxID=2099387 RepID=UPI00142788D2|nr:M48 family metallopeptidase [Tolypothrix sp. PCC 7910]QIR35776.1 M48 family metallopeptidase [Tolypothrix sp. PCC 7910]